MDRSQSPQTPLEPYLVPEAPEGESAQPAAPPAVAKPQPVAILRPKPSKAKRLKGPKPEMFTMEQAFDYSWKPDGKSFEEANIERALRAVGFLLHQCSEMGNERMEGNAANGLGFILEETANKLRYVHSDCRDKIAELEYQLRCAKGE